MAVGLCGKSVARAQTELLLRRSMIRADHHRQ